MRHTKRLRAALLPRNDLPFQILLFLVIFPPLAFGAVETWSLAVMECASFLCLWLLLLDARSGTGQAFVEVPGIVPLMLLLGYILVQTVPLPPFLLRVLSPSLYALCKETLWTAGADIWVPLSVSRKATLAEFFRYASYAAVYISAVQLLARPGLLKRAVAALIIFASLLAFFSMLQHLVSNGRIYWFRELTLGGTPFGPYVNRNHYAGLMGMVFPVILSLFLLYRPPVKRAPLRQRIVDIFNHPKTNIHALLGFSAVLTATSIFVSLSRGGIASVVLSLAFLSAILNAKLRVHRKGLLLLVTAIVILYAVGWFGWDPIFERFRNIRSAQGDISELRLDIWKDSLGMARDFALTGTGFGTFLHSYPAYRTILPEGIADHAHNDYVELFTDGGIVGTVLVAWFLFSVLRRSFRIFSQRQEQFSLYLFAGSSTGILAILLHSFTDFNLQIGANGMYLFLLLGLSVSAAHTRMRDDQAGTLLGPADGYRARPGALAVGGVLLACLIFVAGQSLGGFLENEVQGMRIDSATPKSQILAVRDTFNRASVFDPLEASYRCGSAAADALLIRNDAARAGYGRCLGLQPTDSGHLRSFGLFLSAVGDTRPAEQLLQAAIAQARTDANGYRIYGSWLISAGRVSEGLDQMRQALSLEPSRTSDYVTLLVLAGLTDQQISRSLPDLSQPHMVFARYLERVGRDELAAEAYEKAVALAPQEHPASPSIHYAASRFYSQRKQYAPAAVVLKKGIELFPAVAALRLRLAECYEAMNDLSASLDQYRQVLAIDPKNEQALRKLQPRP